MILVDTHCHLSDPKFEGDREGALERAWAAGLGAVVEIGDTEVQWAPARALAAGHPGRVYWCAGFHPYEAGKADPGLPLRLKRALSDPACVAAGEIGLDYYKHCDVPRDVQKKVFETLAAVGAEAGKPLVLHCREASPDAVDAQEDMLGILAARFSGKSGVVAGVAHCFQGTVEHAKRFVALGFLVGVDAPVTYPKAQPLRDLVSALPLESLLLETDSPYLPPQERRGGRNEPSYLPVVAEAVARLKGVPVERVAEVSTRNAELLYGFSVKNHR